MCLNLIHISYKDISTLRKLVKINLKVGHYNESGVDRSVVANSY